MIAAANLRTRWRELLATVLAVATGVGLLGAVLLAANAARPPVQDRFAATSALVVPPAVTESRTGFGDGRVRWSAAEASALVARLGDAVADRSFPAVPMPGGRPAGNPDDREGGHGVASLALGGSTVVAGEAPRVPGEAVVGAALGVPPGATLPVLFPDAIRDIRVTGLTDAPGVYLTDAEAARYAPGVRTIGVLGPVPQAPPGTTVLTGEDRGTVDPLHDSRVRHRGTQLLAVLGLLTATTTVVVVSAALSTAVAGRRRELGLLRVVGATPGQVRRIVLGEAALVGVAGAIAGIPLAAVLGPLLYRGLVAVEAEPPVDTVPLATGPLLTAAATGVLLALAGGLAASRTGARAAPLDAVGDRDAVRAVSRPRLVAGIATAVVGVVLAVLTAGAAGDGRLGFAFGTGAVLVVAAALLAPVVIGVIARRTWPTRRPRPVGDSPAGQDPVLGDTDLGRRRTPDPGGAVRVVGGPEPARRRRSRGAGVGVPRGVGVGSASGGALPWGVTAALTRAELAAAPARAAAVAAPAIVAVGFAVLVGGIVDTMAAAYPAQRTAALAGTSAVEQDAAPGLPDASARALAVPGARIPLPTVLVLPGRAGPIAVDGVGTDDGARPGETVLSTPLADDLGVTTGGTLDTRFADGTVVPLRVARVLPPDERRGDVALARADVRAHDPSALTRTAFVPTGAVPDRLPAGAVARDAQSYALAEYAVDARLTDALAAMLVAVSAGYGALAVAGGIAAAVRSRRADLHVLAACGATRGQLVRFAAAETGTATLVGALLGLLVTLPPLAAVASGLATATGVPVTPVLDPAGVVVAVGVCLLAATGTAAVTAVRAAR